MNKKKKKQYVSTYNKNNPGLFIGITKTLEQLKNYDRIKNTLNNKNH